MRSVKLNRRGVAGQVITIFIVVMIIAVIVAMVFIFTTQVKNQAVQDSAQRSEVVVTNETNRINSTNIALVSTQSALFPQGCAIINVINNSNGVVINSNNYTLTNCTLLASYPTFNNSVWNVSYRYNYVTGLGYFSVNSTETAGYGLVSYLPIIFIALIFGVLLALVLKMFLPYINVGTNL